MRWKQLLNEDQGAVLLGAIVVLVAITLIGVTLMTISTMEVDMAANEKCKEVARYNGESCAVSTIKLVKMVATMASETGELGIPEGDGRIQGITYAEAVSAGTNEAEFALKVLGELDGDTVCDDVTLTPQNANMDATANILEDGSTGNMGTASNRQIAGYSYGIGLGGAGGGGISKWVIVACRGGSCGGDGRHFSYARYKRVLGVPGGM